MKLLNFFNIKPKIIYFILFIIGCTNKSMKYKNIEDKNLERLLKVYIRTGKINIKIDGNPLIHIASKSNDEITVAKLVQMGVDALAKDKLGRYADEVTENKEIKNIISNGKILSKYRYRNNLNERDKILILHIASFYGDKEIVDSLLLNGNRPDGNEPDKIKMDRTPLMLASSEGYVEISKSLILKGADVNKEDLTGKTSLMFASQNGHKELVELLLLNHADPNMINFNVTALMLAAQHRHLDVIKSLLNTKININKRDKNDKCTALHIAVFYDYKEILKILLQDPRVDITKEDRYGRTALILALDENREELAKILIKKGSPFNPLYHLKNEEIEKIKTFIQITNRYYKKAKYTPFNLCMAVARLHSYNFIDNEEIREEYFKLISCIINYIIKGCIHLKLENEILDTLIKIDNDENRDIKKEIIKKF